MARRKAPTFEELKQEYKILFDTMKIKSSWTGVVSNKATQIKQHKVRYENISRELGGNIPWQFIGVIHSLESGLDFTKHLHNGDSLKQRTRRVPRGHPKQGTPPFTFEESAVDALKIKGYHRITQWSPERMLYELERYNGWGYRQYHSDVLSPYLWSGSTHYTRGKYVSDGKWSSTAVSQQIGTALLLKMLLTIESPTGESRKLRFLDRIKKLIMTILGGGALSWTTLEQVRTFIQDNTGILALGIGAIAFITYKYIELKTKEDMKEGRYIPSNLVEKDNNV